MSRLYPYLLPREIKIMVRQLTSSPLEHECTRKMRENYAGATTTGSHVKRPSKIEETEERLLWSREWTKEIRLNIPKEIENQGHVIRFSVFIEFELEA